MSAVPKDFEESARIHGATNLQLLLKVMVPLAKPGIATILSLIHISSIPTIVEISLRESRLSLIMVAAFRIRRLFR